MLKGQVSVITGAGSGIGKATAQVFSDAGSRTVLVDIKGDDASSTAEELRSRGHEAISIHADVTNRESVEGLISSVTRQFGKIDVLINNAGINSIPAVPDLSEQEWDRVISVNLKGVFLCCKYVIPEMIQRGRGCIVNVSSVYGLVGAPDSAAYCASKGGVIALTKSMALYCAPYGIRVNCICPGAVETPLLQEDLAAASDPEQARRQRIEMHALKRFATPQEIAKAILFLASDESSFMIGSCLVVDGGWTAK